MQIRRRGQSSLLAAVGIGAAALLNLGASGGGASLAAAAQQQGPLVLEAEKPAHQKGSTGQDKKAGASGGEVLGRDFGSKAGDYAEYELNVERALEPAYVSIRYARQFAGAGRFEVAVDGTPVGFLEYQQTGGWGDRADQFRVAVLKLPRLDAGKHTLRLTVAGREPAKGAEAVVKTGGSEAAVAAVSPVVRAGERNDKNSVGHGRNVALYTGAPSRFFFATHELGNIFSAADGGTVLWHPDHVRVSPEVMPTAPTNINLDTVTVSSEPPAEGADTAAAAANTAATGSAVTQTRDVCVTEKDVIVSRIRFVNKGDAPATATLEVRGDCRESFDWRGGKGGQKVTRLGEDGTVTLVDRNVFPEVMPAGLFMVIGGSQKPQALGSTAQGEYTLTYAVSVPARGEATLTLACAVARDEKAARQNLAATLRAKDPIADNRRAWEAFYRKDVPSFACSDPKLTELYDFRWFLLRFSTAGGDLGLFRYPVVLEGRQAFQTYCCYSAPFMAFDRNWMADPKAGWGHIASMVHAAYDDGRFPWYASPRTNDVPLNHASKTGMSLLPWTLWRWYQIHGDRKRIEPLYPGMAKNVRWWIADRDPDSNGLFSIDHQLETGMDDLFRRWKTKNPARYEAVDATVYAYLNLRAVAHLARELGRADDARAFDAYAEKSKQALLTVSWDPKQARFLDRNPDTGEMADYNSICTFYPLMTDVMGAEHLPLVRNYLLNEKEYWTAHPIPALSQTDPDFDPVKGYWRGPSWPAATSHVIEGFATTAKRLDRSLLPEAAELFRRAAANHLQPRADFYERYNPFDGRGLSNFRDYMHSWWIDIYIRHVAGLMLEDDGSLTIDPLPLDLESYALRNVPVRGHKIDVLYNDPQAGPGLTVLRDGKPLARKPDFKPGGAPLKVALPR